MGAPKGHPPYNVNGEGGRPKEHTSEFIEKLADKLDQWLEDENNCYVGKFFDINRLNPDCGSNFSSENERFCRSYRKALKMQETRIYVGALKNKYNAKMACFGLMNNHGWSEKAESKVTATVSLPLEIVNQTKELIDDTTATESNERGRSSCY